jgi:putative ABC transport system permease protein
VEGGLQARARGAAANVRYWVEPARAGARAAMLVGVLALVMCMTGVYGVTAFLMRQRLREIGIRLALGATSRQVLATLYRETVPTIAGGTLAGLALGAAAARLIAGLLFGLSPLDPLTFLAAPLLFGATAALALYIPMRAAARVDPLTSLRHD